ncbi:hypothetical protein BCR44DRAFT_93683 [Catenaria anguillulae PL171]|uniref:Uncharacterized protein n=1 Tax=Catenaria anguillulae PL171 TaxID=765915 RepID=A0A1Y2HDB5_9FUNG|nr:hypothetical protein BCR44DRAFT_93683 [Catenaria anguillulae PL171]
MVFPTADSYRPSLALRSSRINGMYCYGITPPTIFDRFATIAGSNKSLSSFPRTIDTHFRRLTKSGQLMALNGPILAPTYSISLIDLRTSKPVESLLSEPIYNLTQVALALIQDPAAKTVMTDTDSTVTRAGSLTFDPTVWPPGASSTSSVLGPSRAPITVPLETSLSPFMPGSSLMHVQMPRDRSASQLSQPSKISPEFLMFMSCPSPFKSLQDSAKTNGARPSGFGPGVLDMLFAMGYIHSSRDRYVRVAERCSIFAACCVWTTGRTSQDVVKYAIPRIWSWYPASRNVCRSLFVNESSLSIEPAPLSHSGKVWNSRKMDS